MDPIFQPSAIPSVVVIDAARSESVLPVALAKPVTIEILMADGSSTGKVRPTPMQLRAISFGLGISLERLSGHDGSISIRFDRAGRVVVVNGAGTRFTPKTTAGKSLIAGFAAAVRFNSHAAGVERPPVLTALGDGAIRMGAFSSQTAGSSGATWAPPAGGLARDGFGLGKIIGFPLAAFATGILVFRLGRRMGLGTETWHQLAYHSPLERPA